MDPLKTRPYSVNLAGMFPLRHILIVMFVFLIVATVGIVGYLSLRNGQDAVRDVATQFLGEVTTRVEQTLPSYLSYPVKINQINALNIASGRLNLADVPGLERHFWNQVRIFDSIAFIGVGLENKDNIGAERFDKDLITIRSSSKASKYIFGTFQTNERGEKIKLLHSIPFEPRKRPWYLAAVQADKPVWSKIYPNTAGITSYLGASMPFYDRQKRLQGVLITTISLDQIGKFLKSLKIGKTGQVFIIERNGWIVATSTGEQPFARVDKKYGAVRIHATQTKNPVTRATARFLADYLKTAPADASLNREISIDGERHFMVVRPFRDKLGLDWLITVVVPEQDFMDRINANTRWTIIFCLLAIGLATLMGVLLTQKITEPLRQVSQEMDRIAHFELGQDDEQPSMLSEIHLIQSSLVAMKRGLHSFEKYVSSDVVRRLIRANREAVLGVEPANVTVFFSDIVDFTSIAESLSMDDLIDVVSEYLGEMSNIIIFSGGTLDKYIGDAIMGVFD